MVHASPIRLGAIPEAWFVSFPEAMGSSAIRLRALKKQPVLYPSYYGSPEIRGYASPQSEGSSNNCVFLVGPGRLSEDRGCNSSVRLEIPGRTNLHHLPQTGGSPRIGNGALGFFKRPGRGAEEEDDCKAPSGHQGAMTLAARPGVPTSSSSSPYWAYLCSIISRCHRSCSRVC